MLTLDDKVIIIEVDENQHESYPEECESSRMINLSMVYGGSPVVFIRYNPDRFEIDGDTQEVSKKSRHELLEKTVRHYIDITVESLLTVEYLFYDDERQERLERTTEFLLSSYR